MSTTAPFKWIDQKQDRATRVPATEWKSREARLRELYSQMTLAELMEVMKSEGFVATRKQYDHQFRKWGLQKYGIANSTEKEPGGSCTVEDQVTAMLDGDTIVAPDASEKRPRSIPRVELSGSRLSASLQPSSKEAKMTDADGVPRSPRLDIHAALPLHPPIDPIQVHSGKGALENRNSLDPSASSGVDFWLLPGPTNTVSEPAVMEAADTGAKADPDCETILMADTRLLDELIRSMQGLEVDCGVLVPPFLDQSIQKPREEPYRRHLHTAIRLTNAARCFPSKMLPSLISQTCQSRLCRAADWLYAVWNKQDSFCIYSLLTKFEEMSDGGLSRSHVLSPMTLSCVRSAETPSQRTLARELLFTRLRFLEDDGIGLSETLLSHMLLAHLFALDGNFALSEQQLDTSMPPSLISKSVDTSFEVLSYLYYKHPRPVPARRTRGRSHKADLVHQYLPSITHYDFVAFAYSQRCTILSLRNGSVEWDHPSAAVSKFVRCCIAWCAAVVPKDGPSMYPCFDTALHAERSSPPYASTWQETMVLYNYFNKILLDEEYGRSTRTPLARTWTEKTRGSLGISATELLIVCCNMTAHFGSTHFGSAHGGYTNKKFYNHGILVLELGSIRNDLTEVGKQSDEELVTQFLRHLYLRTKPLTLVSKVREHSQGPLKHSTTTISASEDRQSSVHKEGSPFNSTMNGPMSHRSTRGGSVKDMVVDEPMMTSSCRSSNTSYKRMKDVAVSIFNRRFNSMGSRLSLSSWELRLSLAGSIDRMSDIMRDSLHISNPPGLDQVQQVPAEHQEQ